MHKLVWNRMEFPIQEKREECFRIQKSLLPVFLQHKYHVPTPRRRGETPSPDLLTVRRDGKCCCSLGDLCGKICRSTCPSDRQVDARLSLWQGSSVTTHILLPALGVCCGAVSPSCPGALLRGGAEMQHAGPVGGRVQSWAGGGKGKPG